MSSRASRQKVAGVGMKLSIFFDVSMCRRMAEVSRRFPLIRFVSLTFA